MRTGNWPWYKAEILKKCVELCDKYGYPTNDEQLCILIEGALDDAVFYLNERKEDKGEQRIINDQQ